MRAIPVGGRIALQSLGQDVRYALRVLRKAPLFTAVSIATLGLGIGASTSMFSVLHEVILYRSPFRDPGQLVTVFTAPSWLQDVPGMTDYWDRNPIEIQQYRTWRENATQFQDVAVHRVRVMTLTGLGESRRVMVGVASASLFPVLGVQPTLGRWFLPEEEGFTQGGGEQVAILSHDMWQTGFASNPEVVGETLTLNDRPFTVVGVLPRGFRLRWLGLPSTEDVDVGKKGIWIPVGASGWSPEGGSWEAIGRLREGTSPEQAITETRSILVPNTDLQQGDVRLLPRKEADTQTVASPLVLLFGSTGLLLLIACANVALLLAGEALARQRELTTRYALGAGVRRIARQLTTESLLLGLFGTVVGAAIAWAAVRVIVAVAPPIPRIDEVGINLPVFLFAALLGLMTGLISGTVPAVVSARRSGDVSLRRAGSTNTLEKQPLQRAILPGLVALTVMLLIAGGLFVRSYGSLLAVDPGFDAENLASIHLSLPQNRYPGGNERWSFYDQALRETQAIPGVRSAGLTSSLPFPGKNNINSATIWKAADDPQSDPGMQGTSFDVTNGYLETLGLRLIAGRTFTEADDADGEPVMVISESMARRYWPNASPVGSQVRYWAGTHTIIGVVGDAKRQNLASEVEPTYYVPLAQRTEWLDDPTLLVRTENDPSRVIPELRSVIWTVDPSVPVDQASTMTTLVAASASDARYRALLMGVFGALAVLLAATGVFGVSARTVEQRTRELGIQMALGATRAGLIGLAGWTTVRRAGLGILLGVVVSIWADGLLSAFLFGVEGTDALTYGAVIALVAIVCLASSYLSTWRITRVNPVEVLRAE
jgi:putative ABC transport system permease protein